MTSVTEVASLYLSRSYENYTQQAPGWDVNPQLSSCEAEFGSFSLEVRKGTVAKKLGPKENTGISYKRYRNVSAFHCM